jgi:hypothetical protein
MKRHAGMLLAGLALAVALAVLLPSRVHHAPSPAPGVTHTGDSAGPARDAGSGSETGVAPGTGAIAHPEIGFHSRERLEDHFRRHGRDFGAPDAAAYLRLAQALRDRPAGGAVLEGTRADGVVTRFDRGTGAFLAFDRDLVIRTFFKPNDGRAYFDRQLHRPASAR